MIRVVVDDIAFARADAVVRPATATLEPTTAALRRLEQVGGSAFWQQLKVQQDLPVGAAVVTGGGDLPAREDGTLIAVPVNRQDSSLLGNLAAARALVIRPPFAPAAAKGSRCELLRLPE